MSPDVAVYTGTIYCTKRELYQHILTERLEVRVPWAERERVLEVLVEKIQESARRLGANAASSFEPELEERDGVVIGRSGAIDFWDVGPEP